MGKKSRNYKHSLCLEGYPIFRRNGLEFYGSKFTLGEVYYIQFGRKKPMRCEFIQVTKFGYNFLNLDTYRCILSRHLYVPTKMRDRYEGEEKFVYTIGQLKFVNAKDAKQWVIDAYTQKEK